MHPLVLAATIEANWEAVAIAGLLVVLMVVRDVKMSSTLGSISTGVEQVSKQVNHVEDPDNEPTLREMVVAQGQQLEAQGVMIEEQRIDMAALKGAQIVTAQRVKGQDLNISALNGHIAELRKELGHGDG